MRPKDRIYTSVASCGIWCSHQNAENNRMTSGRLKNISIVSPPPNQTDAFFLNQFFLHHLRIFQQRRD